MINKKCIVRGDRSGVFFGTVKSINGQTVEMENVRRLWYWDGANSISDLAIQGTKKPNNCKFTKAVEQVLLTDVVEINVCTNEAITNLENVKAWTF
jgi:hypothetical protein